MEIEMRHFRAFLAIAEELNVTRAAERLHMTQPALSRTLQQLEDGVGIRLVERSTRFLALTPGGEAFLRKAQDAISSFDDALNPELLSARPLRLGHAWSAVGRHTAEILKRWGTSTRRRR